MSENYEFKPTRMHRKVGVTLRIDVCRKLEELVETTGSNRSAIVAMAVSQFYERNKTGGGSEIVVK